MVKFLQVSVKDFQTIWECFFEKVPWKFWIGHYWRNLPHFFPRKKLLQESLDKFLEKYLEENSDKILKEYGVCKDFEMIFLAKLWAEFLELHTEEINFLRYLWNNSYKIYEENRSKISGKFSGKKLWIDIWFFKDSRRKSERIPGNFSIRISRAIF